MKAYVFVTRPTPAIALGERDIDIWAELHKCVVPGKLYVMWLCFRLHLNMSVEITILVQPQLGSFEFGDL
jgi:hypothetical protein